MSTFDAPTLPATKGTLDAARDNLMTSIASSASFLTWTNTETVAEARKRVHYIGLNMPNDREAYTEIEANSFIPFVLVSIPDNGYQAQIDATDAYEHSGTFRIEFVGLVEESITDNPAIASSVFLGVISAIMDDLLENSKVAGCLRVKTAVMTEAPSRVPWTVSDAFEDTRNAAFTITW